MIHGNPIPYDLALFLTQLMVAFAIIVLAIAAKATRKQVEQRLRTFEALALRTTAQRRPAHPDEAIERWDRLPARALLLGTRAEARMTPRRAIPY